MANPYMCGLRSGRAIVFLSIAQVTCQTQKVPANGYVKMSIVERETAP
jgi:hypothetical protein